MKCNWLILFFLLYCPLLIFSQDTSKKKVLEVYGFAMVDIGYNFDQINPDWFDALRITRLPSYKDQFAPDGKVFFGVRQTRFGVKGYTETPLGLLTSVFEFDLFGVSADEGQTTMRLRNAYGEIGKILVGQANSPFMDGDVWPNTVEYWGPTGMVFFRNIQLRYALMQGKNELHVAIERPGATADQGSFENRTELDSVRAHLQVPDFSAHFKRTGPWGHVQVAGMLREMKWKDIHTTGGYDLSGSATGWGLHLSTVLNIGKRNVFRGSFVYGEGIENYMQDAPIDVGVEADSLNPGQITGKALPITGIHAFLDHKWSDKLSTSVGYSSATIDNASAALPGAYKMGEYAIVNIVATPFKNTMVAAELQWGRRKNEDGFTSETMKFHLAFKYNFSEVFYKRND